MPRRPRHELSGIAFHVMNRGVRGTTLFLTNHDFDPFAAIVREGLQKYPVQLLSYEVMDTHWHFVLTVPRVATLSNFMHWVEGTHANRWAGAHRARGRGYVYQGRFKAVPVQTETALIRVCRYVERNALRKNLVSAAQDWTWGSLYARCNNLYAIPLSTWPIPQPDDWVELVNTPQTESELKDLRQCLRRDQPIGDPEWVKAVAPLLGLTLRPVGRPRKDPRPL